MIFLARILFIFFGPGLLACADGTMIAGSTSTDSDSETATNPSTVTDTGTETLPGEAVQSLEAPLGTVFLGMVSSRFEQPLTVLLAEDGLALSGESILFEIESGTGASLSASSVMTSQVGQAEVSFTAGGDSGNYLVRASHAASETSVLFTLVAQPSPPPTLAVLDGNFQVTFGQRAPGARYAWGQPNWVPHL